MPDGLRPFSKGFMASGQRADWLVKCSEPGSYRLTDGKKGDGHNLPLQHLETKPGSLIAWFDVAPSPAPPAPPIPNFAACRPCYLADLTHVTPNVTHSIKLAHMAFAVETDGRSEPFPGPGAPAATLPVGAVAGLSIGGTSMMHHIFHMHHLSAFT